MAIGCLLLHLLIFYSVVPYLAPEHYQRVWRSSFSYLYLFRHLFGYSSHSVLFTCHLVDAVVVTLAPSWLLVLFPPAGDTAAVVDTCLACAMRSTLFLLNIQLLDVMESIVENGAGRWCGR